MNGVHSIFVLLLIITAHAIAGDIVPLAEKVFRADVIVEVQLTFDRPIPKNWPNRTYTPAGMGFPDALIRRAISLAAVSRVLASSIDSARIRIPQSCHVFSSGSRCWWNAHRRKSLRVLLFFAASSDGQLRQIVGVEYETGQYSDLNPEYEALVAAVRAARQWPEERMRAVDASQLWQEQRTVLRAHSNPYAVDLVIAFLRVHQGETVINKEIGSPGEDRRRKLDSTRTRFLTTNICVKSAKKQSEHR